MCEIRISMFPEWWMEIWTDIQRLIGLWRPPNGIVGEISASYLRNYPPTTILIELPDLLGLRFVSLSTCLNYVSYTIIDNIYWILYLLL